MDEYDAGAAGGGAGRNGGEHERKRGLQSLCLGTAGIVSADTCGTGGGVCLSGALRYHQQHGQYYGCVRYAPPAKPDDGSAMEAGDVFQGFYGADRRPEAAGAAGIFRSP